MSEAVAVAGATDAGAVASVAETAVGVALLIVVGYCLVWTRYRLRAVRRAEPPIRWGLDDVQVRIVTVGDTPALVRETVESLPAALGRPVVVSERPIDVEGATVRVVPESFAPDRAAHKARAMEWARRNVGGDEEYALYLDEDTRLPSFEGLPDRDIVQFRRRPGESGSLLVGLTEIHRAGILKKELGFGRYPFHAWGGAIAVRGSVEDAVTWDRATLSEDTAFAWAATASGHSHAGLDVTCDNLAPPSVATAIGQRRRWACMLWETHRLPPAARASVVFQLAAWWMFPLTVLLVPAAFSIGGWIAVLGAVVVGYNLLWSYEGWRLYDSPARTLLALACGGFFAANVINFAGRVWGTLSPPPEFEVTAKR